MKQKPWFRDQKVPKSVKKVHLEQMAAHRDRLFVQPDLRTVFIEMTLNCNEHCRHCGSNCNDVLMKDTLSDDEIVAFLEKLKTQVPKKDDGSPKLPFLSITGGEPLIRPGFIELMKRIKALGYRWGMTSNGLILDEQMAKDLKSAGMSTVSISLDGLKESHEWFRQCEGSYDKAIDAVKNLMAVGFKNVMVTTVCHKRNIHELPEIYKVVKGFGCDNWRIINVEPIGRALKDDEIRLDTKDYQYMIDFIIKYRSMEQQLDIMFGCNHYLGPKREREVRPWYFMCTAGVYTAGIFYNGDIGGCLDIERTEKTIQGNIRKDDFYDVWLNGYKQFRRDKTVDSETCKDCKHRRFCNGGGYHTWDNETNEPRLCMLHELKTKIQ